MVSGCSKEEITRQVSLAEARVPLSCTVDRIAAELDDQAEVVAGASRRTDNVPLLLLRHGYSQRCADKFPGDGSGRRKIITCIDFVMVTLFYHLHYSVARAFLEQGIHVVSDKPMTFDLQEARALVTLVEQSHLVLPL